MEPVEEMKKAAALAVSEDFMGFCEGGFPLVAFENNCQFCGASSNEKCKRAALKNREGK